MNRKEFLKRSGILLAGLGTSGSIHSSILRALAIDPIDNSTFADAEHVVILMQENRSFDHTYGALRGVRGFLDKRALVKEDGHSVFFQQNDKGAYAVPARLDLKNTKSTWMSSLPHSWGDQQHAFNKGKYDKWLQAKSSGHESYQDIPLTLGYYNREDIPFYYQLADAFTVFDQYFCSSFTGTTPNRLFLWSGTIREQQNGDAIANVLNQDISYPKDKQAYWKSFPELLEEHNFSWKIYQNEISLPKGLSGEQESWLCNFTDNPIEWFDKFKVKFSEGYHAYIPTLINELKEKIAKGAENKEWLLAMIKDLEEDRVTYAPENFAKLPELQQRLHKKAFTTNSQSPDYHDLAIGEDENGERLVLPKGDILHEFRKDVAEKKLPLVSWLVAPAHFSDHPGSPWYGAWYISEVLNILTQDPEVWKKTIFIINYDENDGYFDHVVPFVPPLNPQQPVDIHGADGVEYVDKRQKYMKEPEYKNRAEGTVGLGYRVPMIIASPWTKGGFVNSEVSDHTSVLQFLETFIQKKYNQQVTVDNISPWRRAVCGNLISAFNRADSKKPSIDYIDQKDYAQLINSAKNKPVPQLKWYRPSELDEVLLEQQERGLRRSNTLPYDFMVNLQGGKIKMTNLAKKGVPLLVYDRLKFDKDDYFFSYTLYAKQSLSHQVNAAQYDFDVFGPNGFFRKFMGQGAPSLEVSLINLAATNEIQLHFKNKRTKPAKVVLKDLYLKNQKEIIIKDEFSMVLNLDKMKGWYDLQLVTDTQQWQFAGRIESGKASVSDPHWA